MMSVVYTSEFITVQSLVSALTEHKDVGVEVVPVFEDGGGVDRMCDNDNGQGVAEPGTVHWCQVFIAQSYFAAPLTDLGPLFGNQADEETQRCAAV
jgi:hypothetical protein